MRLTHLVFGFRIHAQNRLKVVEALFRIYNQVLGDLGKFSLEQFVRTVQKMLQRGSSSSSHHNRGASPGREGGGGSKVRIVLSPNVLLELLYGAYFAIYNGFQLGGSQVSQKKVNEPKFKTT